MAAAPTGGNACNVEYTVIDDKNRVKDIWQIAYATMEAKAKKHVYTHSFNDFLLWKNETIRKDREERRSAIFAAPPSFYRSRKIYRTMGRG